VKVVLLLAMAACLIASGTLASAGAQIVVHDDRGVTTHFAAAPARIVSLLPSLTEAVCTLGACANLVGIDRFSNWPAEVARLPRVGSMEDAQVERVVALRPDVVLLGPSVRAIDRLEMLGLKVVAIQSQNHADVQRMLETIARLLGRPGAAQPLWAAIEADLKRAAQQVPAALRGRHVYFEITAAPHAAGVGSFIDETLQRLGMANAVPAALGPFPRLNPEFVVRLQPDIVMATRRDLAEMAHRPGWAGLRALQRARSCGFSIETYDVLIRPGPRLGEAALELARCLSELNSRS